MIYPIPKEMYPKTGQYHEKTTIKDLSNSDWEIAIIENGFMVRSQSEYHGDDVNFINEGGAVLKNPKHFFVINEAMADDKKIEVYLLIKEMLQESTTVEAFNQLYSLCYTTIDYHNKEENI